MGNLMGRFSAPAPPAPARNHGPSPSGSRHSSSSSSAGHSSKKRKRLSPDAEASKMMAPTRKKLKNTSKYIYETLFEKGQDSDVTISSMGATWSLHKVYLCQSPYFDSMFSGNWVETHRRRIHISVPDANVTREALDVALGSLYRDEVTIAPIDAINVLAAASLLQLDPLIHHCEEVMKDNIGPLTATKFYEASWTYGLPWLGEHCFMWLLKNLMTSPATLLVEITVDLMAALVSNADLFVMQVEMDVYTLLKKWLFLKLEPKWLLANPVDPETTATPISTGTASKTIGGAAESHLATLIDSDNVDAPTLLESELGRRYAKVFRRLRFQHIVTDLNSLHILEKERIIPRAWLQPIIPAHWERLLKLDSESDTGPSSVLAEDFRKTCVRCGRVLLQDVDHFWRWTGFNFGVDLLVSYQKRQITVKRNTGSHKCLTFVSLQPKRDVVIAVAVASFDKLGNPFYEKASPLTKLSLAPDEERVILSVDRHAPFPLLVSVQMLFYTPTEKDLKWCEASPEEDAAAEKEEEGKSSRKCLLSSFETSESLGSDLTESND